MHTSGPWRAEPFNEVQWAVKAAGKWDFICTTAQDNDKANAILMAGAPDMLAALEAQERLDKMWDATENKAFSMAKKIKLWEDASRETIRLRKTALDKVKGGA